MHSTQTQIYLPDHVLKTIFSYLPSDQIPNLILVCKKMRRFCLSLFQQTLEGDLRELSERKFFFLAREAEHVCRSLKLVYRPFSYKRIVSYVVNHFSQLQSLEVISFRLSKKSLDAIQTGFSDHLSNLTSLCCVQRQKGSLSPILEHNFLKEMPSSLQKLQLQGMSFLLQSPENYQTFFNQHQRLTSLDISYGYFSTFQNLHNMTQLTNLERLHLNKIQFFVSKIQDVGTFFRSFTNLKALSIAESSYAFAIDSAIQLPQLTYLNISAIMMPKWTYLSALTNLRTLKTAQERTELTPEDVIVITGNLTKLQTLTFNHTRLSLEQVEKLAACLTDLKHLAFDNCDLHNEEVDVVCHSITRLTALDLYLNKFTSKSTAAVSRLQSLKKLNLLYGEAFYSKIRYSIETLTHLTDLRYDRFSTRDLQLLAKKLTKLQNLHVGVQERFKTLNKISFTTLQYLTSLTFYAYTHTRVQGVIPFFTQLTSLERLKIVFPNHFSKRNIKQLKQCLTRLELLEINHETLW